MENLQMERENIKTINGEKYVEITKKEYDANNGNDDYLMRYEEPNPDLKKIFEYCRYNDYQEIIPNVTINGSHMTKYWYDFLAKTCGAVAVSFYDDNNCFNAVSELTSRGLKQTNIHAVLSEETFEDCMNLIDKVGSDERLHSLNAVVFLLLKQKGRGEGMSRISESNYKLFVDKLFKSGINFGFDSCGSGRLLQYGVSEEIEKFIEPCESGLFSSYINAEGKFFPCSFTENLDEWSEGIDIIELNDFNELWNGERVKAWRQTLLNNCRQCPKYKI